MQDGVSRDTGSGFHGWGAGAVSLKLHSNRLMFIEIATYNTTKNVVKKCKIFHFGFETYPSSGLRRLIDMCIVCDRRDSFSSVCYSKMGTKSSQIFLVILQTLQS